MAAGSAMTESAVRICGSGDLDLPNDNQIGCWSLIDLKDRLTDYQENTCSSLSITCLVNILSITSWFVVNAQPLTV